MAVWIRWPWIPFDLFIADDPLFICDGHADQSAHCAGVTLNREEVEKNIRLNLSLMGSWALSYSRLDAIPFFFARNDAVPMLQSRCGGAKASDGKTYRRQPILQHPGEWSGSVGLHPGAWFRSLADGVWMWLLLLNTPVPRRGIPVD